ncbi:glycosyltransferase family 2 protein [Staphylococcus warneri]|uniref:glycosyltransferase family 2 protein n=1 Tax=Staphylococcus TaxID=1279 RepID=UPI002175595F|nr:MULTISPECIES: glycosyltransferase [Staphylococcus]
MSVYNKEMFIEKCIQSIIDLNIDKSIIEAIFIDDASIDNSYNILSQYVERYDFIRSIQLEKNTGGPAEPRNIGIREAKGKYITIVDADDWLDSNGLPSLVFQMNENKADIGFGQCFKHRNKEIVKVANFASYDKKNNLIPYEMYKIFRAIGPWGKVFKRETVINNDIKFKNLKYAEDKLFYCELISKSKNASITNEHVYHVNRYIDNISLVKETDNIAKINFNLEVLKDLIQMDLPEYAKRQILCRIIEVDFISRIFLKKAFLKAENKAIFYEKFNEAIKIITDYGYDINELLDNERYKNVYLAYCNNQKEFENFIKYMLYEINYNKYIKNNNVYLKYPKKFENIPDLVKKCVAIHKGTELINETYYEVIQLFKKNTSAITGVQLVKVNDETIYKDIDYVIKDNHIYIKCKDIHLGNNDFNIKIKVDAFDSSFVYASYPYGNNNNKLNRQNAKLIFNPTDKEKNIVNQVAKISDNKKANYLKKTPAFVVTIKKTNLYRDLEFKEKVQPIQKGEVFEIISSKKSSKNILRLITKDGTFLSSNTNIVLPITIDNITNTSNKKSSRFVAKLKKKLFKK